MLLLSRTPPNNKKRRVPAGWQTHALMLRKLVDDLLVVAFFLLDGGLEDIAEGRA
jgi:hypothetical protein